MTTAVEYHHITSYNRYDMKGHVLDWANRPVVYKTYRGAEYFPLPHPESLPRISLEHLNAPSPLKAPDRESFTVEKLSAILALTCGITGQVRTGGKNFHYRSAPSAGALYPVEVYLAADNIEGLGHGIYHYDVSGHRLCRLRPENIMPFADTCIRDDKSDPPPVACFFFSAIVFRSAWKYRERAFRYLLLDTGHALENLVLTLKALMIPATVHYDIERDSVNRLLGFDTQREICFACVRVAGGILSDIAVSEKPTRLPRHVIEESRVSPKEVVYREIDEIALASSTLPTHNRHPSDMVNHLGLIPEYWKQIEPPYHSFEADFSNAVTRRRSRRNFMTTELSKDAFLNLFTFLSRTSEIGHPPTHSVASTLSTGLLVQNVESISSGFYLCDFSKHSWALVRPGRLGGTMAAVCLDQQWLQGAAIHFCFLTNLVQLDRNWGAMGYRYAMLNAGRLAQRIYLAATALNIGCCGIGALYDTEARTLLGLNQNSALIYLVAAGPVKH